MDNIESGRQTGTDKALTNKQVSKKYGLGQLHRAHIRFSQSEDRGRLLFGSWHELKRVILQKALIGFLTFESAFPNVWWVIGTYLPDFEFEVETESELEF